jgi:hypothetical protein
MASDVNKEPDTPNLTESEKPDPWIPDLVALCPEQALPFRIIFAEYASRRGEELKKYAGAIFKVPDGDDPLPILK